MNALKRNAPAAGNSRGGDSVHGEANARILLDRLDGVQVQGKGWRSRCPACGGRSRKLSVTESDNRVLVHCFGGCKAIEVLQAVGLTWADLFPPRHWPESPDERRRARRAIREAGWAAALSVLTVEAHIVRLAAGKVAQDEALDWDDFVRLCTACDRINSAANALTEAHG